MKTKITFLIIFLSVLVNLKLLAQAPNLGTASTFGLFTSAGEFNNTGSSIITGHIGTHAGALTGFPPGIVNGNIYQANATTSLAATDIAAAYSDLSTRTCSNPPLSVTLGGETLTPGVYCTGAATTLNGMLTFDGLGDPSGVFIIQINGAFDVTSSNIIFVNGASACNIYWQVNGAFSIASGASFAGTMINAGAINLSSGSTTEGRLLSTVGAINIDNVNVNNTCEIALPLKLISFFAIQKDNIINLHWSTSIEENTDYFLLEKYSNYLDWKPITSVQASGKSNTLQDYSAVDTQLAKPDNLYRLKQVDLDGSYTYSHIISLRNKRSLNLDLEISIFPNPVIGKFFVQFNAEPFQIAIIEVLDLNGRLIYNQNINTENGTNNFEFPEKLNLSGQYCLKISINGVSESKLLIKL